MSFLPQPITIQSLFGKNRTFGPITVEVIINEDTTDNLVITKQPVQTGAPITDHAFKEPTVLSMKIRFNDNISKSLSKTYQELLSLQTQFVPLDVTTPKRIYRSMLIASIGQTTDKTTENVLAINLTFQQVILVNIASVQVKPIKQQRKARQTAGTQDTGKKSLLVDGKNLGAKLLNFTDFIRLRGAP